jgi:hypothetical protein
MLVSLKSETVTTCTGLCFSLVFLFSIKLKFLFIYFIINNLILSR